MHTLRHFILCGFLAVSPLLSSSEKAEETSSSSPNNKGTKRQAPSSPSSNEQEPVSKAVKQEKASRKIDYAKIHRGPQWDLHASEIDYLFTHSKDLVCILELGGKFKQLNSVWHDLLGWEKNELLATPYIEFIHPDDVEKTLAYEEDFSPTGLINRFRCKDGSYRWLDWIGLPRLRDFLGECLKGDPLLIARDVTFQKIIEQEALITLQHDLENKGHLKQKTLEAITEIQAKFVNNIFKYGHRGFEEDNPYIRPMLSTLLRISASKIGFLYIKANGKKYYTWETDDTVAANIRSFFIEGSEQRKKIEESFIEISEPVFKDAIAFSIKDITKCPPLASFNKEIPFSPLLLSPLKNQDNEVWGVIGLINRPHEYEASLIAYLEPAFRIIEGLLNEINIWENQKNLERRENARQQAETLEHANTKSIFLTHMSHELRTPLTGLLGMLELIDKDALSQEERSYLQTAHSAGLNLLTLLNDLLDISKMEAGKLKLEHISFNPVHIAQEVIQLLKVEASKKNDSLSLQVDSEIPLYLMGDPLRLKQILLNLIGNAIKFTDHGKITVELKGVHPPQNPHQFILEGIVRDNGIGISPGVQENLYKPFFQADVSMTRLYGGTGLGLFITKKLCEMFKGEIKVISEVGKGSAFHFTLYLDKTDQTINSPKNLLLSPIALLNTKVLVVEDNPIIQFTLKTLLTKEGCKVTTANNGKEGINALETDDYNIVLMDGEMPVMDGITATKQIREQLNKRDLPIVGITAHAFTEDKERFLNAGMNGYLTKPISKELLLLEIKRCLEEKRKQ